MLFRESETIELKEIAVDDIKKEIIAFANCNGGRLYVGVRDDGTVTGLADPDEAALQISNMVRDAIKHSNLALLLSDRCVHTIKAAVFQGTDQSVFKDRREFTCSLMQQMNEVYDFIDFRNQTRATIKNC